VRGNNAIRWCQRAVVLALSLAGVPLLAAAQRISPAAVGSVAHRSQVVNDTTLLGGPGVARTQPRMTGAEVRRAALASTTAAGVGLAVGAPVGLVAGYPGCARNARSAELAAPAVGVSCLFNAGLIYGAYVGSFAGASVGAALSARRSGCPSRESFTRAILGSLVGSVPALAYVATGGSNSAAVGSAIAVSTPLFQISGATVAVSQCRVPAMR